jgi:hypothetical protein
MHATELRVAVASGEGPQRIGDVAGVKAAGSHLVQQRLEGVVQVPVQQQHVDIRAAELPDRRQPAEPAAHHDDAGPSPSAVHHLPGPRPRITSSADRYGAAGSSLAPSTACLGDADHRRGLLPPARWCKAGHPSSLERLAGGHRRSYEVTEPTSRRCLCLGRRVRAARLLASAGRASYGGCRVRGAARYRRRLAREQDAAAVYRALARRRW